MRLPPDWSEFFALLTSHGVRFLIVGAHAMAAHGRPRATQDIDILVDRTEDNARRLGKALQAFGFDLLARDSHLFTQPERMARLGNPPLRIDIMTSITGVGFDEAWAGRLRTKVDGLDLAFLGRRELIENKRATGRPKDLADLALMEEVDDGFDT